MSMVFRKAMVPRRPLKRSLAAAAIVSLIAFGADRFLGNLGDESGAAGARASGIMAQALRVTREHRERNGPPIDPMIDPNRTGLLGAESSEITTSLGDLAAKRTTTNPAMATLLAHLMEQAGVKAGDRVAAGCSGSFPGLFVAMLSAAQALGAEPVIVISLGASSYGANLPGFTLLDLSELLNKRGVLPHTISAASLGGSKDIAAEFEQSVRSALIANIRSAGIPLLESGSLSDAVAERMAIYTRDEHSKPVKVFLNIGGGYADMGLDPWILTIKPGLHRTIAVPESVKDRGVVLAMAARGTPVIHLLHVKGLVERYGLPWDPVPLQLHAREVLPGRFWVVFIFYSCFMCVVLFFSEQRGDKSARRFSAFPGGED
jgi:poly-gamma-glutamate system protein